MTLEELNNALNKLDEDFFLVDYPFQTEVKSVKAREYDKDLFYIDIESPYTNGCSGLYLYCDRNNLDCGELYGLKFYHHTGILQDACKCAEKLEKYLKELK